MKMNKLITVLLSLLMGFNTVGVCYAEEVGDSEEPTVVENIEENTTVGSEEESNNNNVDNQQQTFSYIPSDLDYNTPVVNDSSDGISTIDVTIPSAFQNDINDLKSKYPDVRNQNPYGTCWSFSSIGLMEFDLIKNQKFTRDNDLSELQLAYFTFNNVLDPLGGTTGDEAKYYNENGLNTYLNYGGNYENAIRRLNQWISATNESVVPYTNAANTIKNGLDSSYAYNYNSAYLKNAYMINVKENTDNVKEMIMNHGAVGVMYTHWYDGMTFLGNENAYFDNGKQTNLGGSHAVMIVGWDDNYSKDNFKTAEKPSSNGAWLVRNSWGDYFSYFWMSYETSSLSDTAYAFDCENVKPYDNNYQLDGGLESYLYTNASSVYNKFTVQKKDGLDGETLKAVSVSFTRASDVNYTIDIYTSMYDKRKPETGTKVASVSGKTSYAGVYTIPLGVDNEVKLKPGSDFYVVVTTDKSAVDCEDAFSVVDDPKSDNPKQIWTKTVNLADGKSYYKVNGNSIYTQSYNNFRIKAFTTNNYKQKIDISKAVITKNDDFTSDNPSIKVQYDGKELKKDTDYTLATNGDGTVTITGQGDYTGTLSKTFVSVNSLTIKCKDIVYTGKEVEPEVTVKNGDTILKLNEDYTVTYSNNVKASENAIATIKGKDDYFGSVDVSFQIYNDIGETLKTYSLSLNGLIKFNFTFSLSDSILRDKKAYVLFKLPDGRAQKQYVTDAKNVNGLYRFSCGVYAHEMTQKVKFYLVRGNGSIGKVYAYSIEDYCKNPLNGTDEVSNKVKPLIKSMLNYGGYAQDEFNMYLDNKAYKNVKSDFDDEMANLNYKDLENYKFKVESTDENFSARGVALILKEGTTLRVFINVKKQDLIDQTKITVDGKEYAIQNNNANYYIDIPSIQADKLGEEHIIQVGSLIMKCSALSYVYTCLKNSNVTNDVNVAKAIYLYYLSSKSYFG